MLIVGIAALGCAGSNDTKLLPPRVLAILDKADQFDLLSLEPYPSPDQDRGVVGDSDHFHEWLILGRTSVTDPQKRRDVIKALLQGISEAQEIMVPSCFAPRHAIHASRGGDTVDLLICFQCAQIEIIPSEPGPFLKTRHSLEPVIDKILRDANVPLASKRRFRGDTGHEP
jgi:hypothetical protein